MEHEQFAALTRAMAPDAKTPRRRMLGILAASVFGAAAGTAAVVGEADAAKKQAKNKNRCKKKNKICQPFKPGACCSNRCCPALGAEGSKYSVCAPDHDNQCCPVELGGGYCELVPGKNPYRKCCPPTPSTPDGYCCPTSGSVCCAGNSVQANDYCCPAGAECFDGLEGCRPAQGDARFGAQAAPKPEPMRKKG